MTQLEHALQSAHLAEQQGAGSALISAALLHDISHLLHDFGDTPSMKGLDDVHQYRCLPFRRGLFGPATLEPVCIVGGGFTGLWTAILAKQQAPHLDIVILESDLCGAGASGRNGGCLLTWSAKYFTLRRLFGEAEAVRLVRASEDARPRAA